ncbi:TAXI family TRAP transporter solute-binding subunit [Sulfurospirillum sp. 1612]|uniref:TAXI family TRAP transporter solute-binding subunit n=1 Tax=Sulfurospirillum sp. 1612 TaxID=3094835 RepID=UPI002F92833F
MIKSKILKRVLVTTAVIASMAGSLNAAQKEHRYIIATASTGGTYYPVGVGIATIASIKLAKKYGITFSAITSAGSNENIDMMDKGEAKFAILQGLFGSMAWQGKGLYKGKAKKNLRSITMLWQNVEQFTVYKKYAKTGNIMDLKNLYGEGFSSGGRNSGSRTSSETIMSSLGIDYNKMDVQYLGYTPSSNALQDGKIQGMNTPAGTPTSSVTNAYATIGAKNLAILNFTADDLKKIDDNYPVWTPFTIKAGTYPGQTKDVHTIAQPNLLVVTADTPEQTVYLLTKTIYENLPFLHSVHKATLVMSLQKAIDGLPMPLHPGAAKYYKEMGLKIPARLIAK